MQRQTVQGQGALVAISSLIVLWVVDIVRTEACEKASKFINISLDILYTMIGNIAGVYCWLKHFKI